MRLVLENLCVAHFDSIASPMHTRRDKEQLKKRKKNKEANASPITICFPPMVYEAVKRETRIMGMIFAFDGVPSQKFAASGLTAARDRLHCRTGGYANTLS